MHLTVLQFWICIHDLRSRCLRLRRSSKRIYIGGSYVGFVQYYHLIPSIFVTGLFNGPAYLPIFTIPCMFAPERHLSMASTDAIADNAAPLFSAVSGSARQLFQLLRCINFFPKAHVQITKEGLRFTVEESRAMQGQSVWYWITVKDAEWTERYCLP